MSKPRIVRESTTVTMNGLPWMHESHAGKAALLLYWPEACPYTPEQVMAACERHGRRILGVPELDVRCSSWMLCAPMIYGIGSRWVWVVLTPEFMAEPKQQGCLHTNTLCLADSGGGGVFQQCPSCGTILSDRRKGERRKGDRRTVNKSGDIRTGGRRYAWDDGAPNRRSGNDRRRQP